MIREGAYANKQYFCLKLLMKFEMDEETFLVNRERAVDYLNSLDKVVSINIDHLVHENVSKCFRND